MSGMGEAGAGRVVVCLHGLGRTPADWDGVRGELARFGEVRTPRLPREPAAALAIVRSETPPGAIVIGHSIGGVLALRLELASQLPLTALVLTDSFFPPARNGRGTIASLRDYGAHRVAYLRGLRGRAGAPSSGSSRTGGFAALGGLIRLAVRRRDFDDAAGAVAAPVLVVHARDDHHVPIDFALATAKSNAGWEVAVLSTGGHHAHVTEPARWFEAVAPFLERAEFTSRSQISRTVGPDRPYDQEDR